jgi:hypothetical protein
MKDFKTWYVSLREEHRFRMNGNKIPRRQSEPSREEGKDECIKFQHAWGDRRAYRLLVGKPEGDKRPFEDLGVNENTIINIYLKNKI